MEMNNFQETSSYSNSYYISISWWQIHTVICNYPWNAIAPDYNKLSDYLTYLT